MDQSRVMKTMENMGRRRKEMLIFRGKIDKKEAGNRVSGLA